MANKNMGNMTTIIPKVEIVGLPIFLSKKNTGNPIRAAMEKQKSCLLVRLNRNLLFTWDKSLGTFT
jgi:hypothetical protein